MLRGQGSLQLSRREDRAGVSVGGGGSGAAQSGCILRFKSGLAARWEMRVTPEQVETCFAFPEKRRTRGFSLTDAGSGWLVLGWVVGNAS